MAAYGGFNSNTSAPRGGYIAGGSPSADSPSKRARSSPIPLASSHRRADENDAGQAGSGGTMSQALVPLTIKQLLSAETTPDSQFLVDGREVLLITVVGQLRDISESSTNLRLTLHDSTGSVDCLWWIETTDAEYTREQRAKWTVGSYLRVYGNPRYFNQQRSIVVSRVQPVTDCNEITFHFLQCISVHLAATRGVPMSVDGGAGAQTTAAPQYTQQATAPAQSIQLPSNVHHMVLDLVKQSTSEDGASVASIIAQLETVATVPQIKDALNFLTNEGHIYTTTDEEHFKTF
eukprot:m51a1_g9572 hypothetical protein (291) ;mRNA; f:924986-926228